MTDRRHAHRHDRDRSEPAEHELRVEVGAGPQHLAGRQVGDVHGLRLAHQPARRLQFQHARRRRSHQPGQVVHAARHRHRQPRHRRADASPASTPTAATTAATSVLAGGNYYTVGNAGNSGKGVSGTVLGQLSDNTGLQMIAAGHSGNTTVVGQTYGTVRQHHRLPAWLLHRRHRRRRRQDRQGRQLPRRDAVRQHAVCHQGQRRQRRQHRLPGGRAGQLPTAATASSTLITPLAGFPNLEALRRTRSASGSPTRRRCSLPTRAMARRPARRARTRRARAWTSTPSSAAVGTRRRCSRTGCSTRPRTATACPGRSTPTACATSPAR